MSILGDPLYDKAVRLYQKTIIKMSEEELILNYIMVEVDFEFPDIIKYPCIPTRVDDNIDIYPLKGRSTITGCEYLVAKNMGCKLYVREGVMIPFKRSKNKSEIRNKDLFSYKAKSETRNEDLLSYKALINDGVFSSIDITFEVYKTHASIIEKNLSCPEGDTRSIVQFLLEEHNIDVKTLSKEERDKDKLKEAELYKVVHDDNLEKRDELVKNKYKKFNLEYRTPFRKIMKELQRKRREYPKKSFLNLLYKLIANSVYGQVAMGISGKKSFDTATKTHVRLEGNALSNPILSSYITGFTRALIGECLHNIQLLNGLVVSVTTDGFISNVENLESNILSMKNNPNKSLLLLYKEIRKYLTTFEGSEEYDDSALEIKHTETKGILS